MVSGANQTEYLLRIGGVGNTTAIVTYCTTVPTWGTASYVYGLAEPPKGTGATWDPLRGRITIGKWRFILDPDNAGPVNFYATHKAPAGELRADANSSTVTWTVNDSASFPDGIYYCDRETVKVTARPTSSTITVVRGYAGSDQSAHKGGDDGEGAADIHTVPPSMTGRTATILSYDPTSATSAADEVVEMQGVFYDELLSTVLWPAWDVITRNPKRSQCGSLEQSSETGSIKWSSADWSIFVDDGGAPVGAQINSYQQTKTKFHADGGYWWFPDLEIVVPGTYDATNNWVLDFSREILGSFSAPEGLSRIDISGGRNVRDLPARGYQVALSHRDPGTTTSYPVFGYVPDGGSYTASDHPIDVILNLILSKDSTNVGAGATSWDRGSKLYPEFAMGVDVANVDVASFESAKRFLGDLRAKWLWLSAHKPEPFESIFERLGGPWGVTVGQDRTGTWRALLLRSNYDGADNAVLDSFTGHHDLKTKVEARALNSIRMETNPDPAGRSLQSVIIFSEDTGQAYYPPGTGADHTLKASPYHHGDFRSEDGILYHAGGLLAARMRRLSHRLEFWLNIGVTPDRFTDFRIGTTFRLHDLAIRDPQTGSRLTASDDGLSAIVTAVSEVNTKTRTSIITAAYTGAEKVSRISPGLEVVSFEPIANVLTVAEHSFTNSVDGDGVAVGADNTHFTAGGAGVGDEVIVLFDNGQPWSDVGAGLRIVAIPDATSVTLSGWPERSSIGHSSVPAGYFVVFDDYDSQTASQIAEFASAADGGADGDPSTLGSSSVDPYVYGD